MLTSDETIRELERLTDEAATEGASPMLLALGTQAGLNIAADLRDLAAMEKTPHAKDCGYHTTGYAGACTCGMDELRKLQTALDAAVRERDALAAAMPSEGADAALAYAAMKTERDEAVRERNQLYAELIGWRSLHRDNRTPLGFDLAVPVIFGDNIWIVPSGLRDEIEKLRAASTPR